MTAPNYAELVERLNHEADEAFEAGYQQHEDSLREAADLIEQQAREIANLTYALEQHGHDTHGVHLGSHANKCSLCDAYDAAMREGK